MICANCKFRMPEVTYSAVNTKEATVFVDMSNSDHHLVILNMISVLADEVSEEVSRSTATMVIPPGHLRVRHPDAKS